VERIDRIVGGLPVGKTSIVYGPLGSLKTYLCLAAVKTFTARGGVAYYIDTELKTPQEHVAPAVYLEAADVGRLLDTLLDVSRKVRYVSPLLVVVDSISAVMHPLVVSHPDYAKEKMRSLAYVVKRLNSEAVTILCVSWQLRGYHGRYLDPALVMRTEKAADGLRVVVERCEDMPTPFEEVVPVEEVLRVALA